MNYVYICMCDCVSQIFIVGVKTKGFVCSKHVGRLSIILNTFLVYVYKLQLNLVY